MQSKDVCHTINGFVIQLTGFSCLSCHAIKRFLKRRRGALSLYSKSLSLSFMVAISSPAKVLITGANGYLATWVIKKYLEAGYSVRGAVRSISKSAFLKDKFGHYGDRFELVAVEDITKDGAFDEAVRGVDAIAHTASPLQINPTNPDGIL